MKTLFSKIIRLSLVSLWLFFALGITGAAAAPPFANISFPEAQAPVEIRDPAAQPVKRLEIRLQRATFDPLYETPDVPSSLALNADPGDGSGYYLVQFHGPILPEWKEALQQKGGVVHDYVPQFAYIVRMDDATAASVRALDEVRWVGLYQPAFRLSTDLDGLVASAESGEPARLVVRSFTGEPAAPLAEQLKSLGAAVRAAGQDSGGGTIFKIELPAASIPAVSQLGGVAWVEPWTEPRLYNEITRGPLIFDKDGVEAHLGLYGAGQIVVVGDTGVSTGNEATMHPDFQGHFYQGTWGGGTCGTWEDYYAHGTHVAGSVLGSGVQDGAVPATHSYAGTNAGIAPESLLWAWGFCSDWSGLPDADPYNDYYGVMYNDDPRVRVNTNSWGYGATAGTYNAFSRETDRFIWDHQDMMVLFAASNDGVDSNSDGIVDDDSMGVPAGAKNIITVGASENYRLSGGYNPGGSCSTYGGCWPSDYPANPVKDDRLSDDPSGMVAYSSRGPVQDGRLKPDIVAPGTNIVSTRYQGGSADPLWGIYNDWYSYCGGTSMATPLAAGASAIVREFYTVTYNIDPTAALVKGTLINGAYDITPGQYRDEDPTGDHDDVIRRPDINQGWGRIDLRSTLVYTLPHMLWFDEYTTGLSTGQVYSTSLIVTGSAHPLHVTLTWSDYPGTEASHGALVNDLDLEVIAPGGVTYYGNDIFDDLLDGDVDRTNNVEGVDLASPAPGAYLIRVRAYNIPQSSQPFALVVSGDMGAVGYLDGTVHDGTLGGGLEGATVRAITATVEYQAATGATGYYTTPVAADTYAVSAWKYGYTLETITNVIVLSDTIATTNFTLTQTSPYTLTGCITDTVTGDPLAATVAVVGPFGDSVTQTTTPQATGCYTLALHGGPYTVTAEARLHQPGESFVNLVSDTVQNFALTAATNDGILWGNVTSLETSNPVEDATIQVTPGLTETQSAGDGSYELQLPHGTYTVTVSAPLYETQVETNVTVPQSNLTEHNYALGTSHMVLLPPEGLGATLDLGSQATRTLTISNTGSGGLEFEIAERTPGFTPASSLMKVTGGKSSPLVGGIRGGSGGPDPYGYTYADSSEPDGPLFEWIDATDGTPLGLSDDGETNVTLPFAFNFYGDSSTDLRVGNNGGAIFGATSGGLLAGNSDLGGGSSRDDIIVPFWDDIDDETGDVYYKTVGTAPNRRFVVEWHDRPHYKIYGGVGNVTFELILYEGTNNIKFQYQDVIFGDTTYPYWDYGGSATVGIRQTGSNYLQYSYNQPTLSDGLSICFQYPGSPPCDPQDILWLSTDPISGTVAAGNTLAVKVGFDASVSEVEQPGDYTAMLQITSNDPESQPSVNYPVTMTVQPPATWGKLQGAITSDRPGGSLEGSLVEIISGATTVYSTTTASDGAYSHWLPGSLYTVTVTASGYVSDQQAVTVSAGVTSTHDVELRLLAPEIAVTPAVLTTTQDMHSLVTRTLTISNLGETDLDFSIVELQGQVMASLSLPTPRAPLHTGPVEVSPAVSAALEQTGKADFWVQMAEQADLSPAYTMDWRERGHFVYDTLREVATRSQTHIRATLDQAGVEYEPHWIINAIYVEGGDSATVNTLKQMDGVARILEHRVLPLPQPQEPSLFDVFSFEPLSPEWGLNIIQAPETWANYTSGEGIIVANIDTGVRYTHEALVAHYRGNLGGGNFDHDFNWYDPQSTTAPVDDHGHGSHTMGTMVGDDSGSNQIGVAPGATWIAADGCDAACPDADLISSGEWMLAPCPSGVTPGDAQCDPDKRPHVVNNSWGDCDTTTTDFFEAQIDAWRAAGIFTAFANGNTSNCGYGSAFCNSMGNPARHYQVTSVGATDSSDNIASFSLWGPTDDSDPRLSEYADIKPEVSAPGQGIRSSTNGSDSSYGAWSGTSMATPHVAGVAALILSANPGLIGQNDLIEDILKETADQKPYSTGCGNEGPGNVPNNAFGWGRVNALHAVEEALLLGDITWVSAAPTSGTVSSGHATDVIVTFDATGLEPGVYTGTLRIQHNDPYASNVNVPLTMTVLMPPPDFTLNKVASDDYVEIGLPFTYTFTVDNAGGDATGIVISDTLPTHTQFAWAGEGGALQGGAVVWNGLNLPGDETLTVSYGVTVTCVASGTQIVNDDYQVTATEWATPTVGAPVTVTATDVGVSADFTFLALVLTEWPVAFTNLSANATGYTWAFGDGDFSTVAHPQHAYGATGAHTVILTATNLCHSAVASQPLTVETYAVALHPATDARHANPDEVVTYTLQVTNTGTLSDTFNLNLSGNVWPTQLSTDTLVLDVGETATVTVSVEIPYGTAGGVQDEVVVTVYASSDSRPSPAVAEALFTTTANTFYGVTLDAAAPTQAADVGETVTYTLEVVNTSNALDTITFSRIAPGWPTAFSRDSMAIAAGGIRQIQVYISVPLTATAETPDTAVIRAVGSGDPAAVTLTTRVATFKCYLPLLMRD